MPISVPTTRRCLVTVVAALTFALGAFVALAGPSAAASSPSPKPSSTSASKPATTTLRYTVRAGDSFIGIANKFGINAATLARANGMRLSSLIVVGKVLTVPGVALPANLPKNLPGKLRANPDRLFLYPLFVAAAKEANVPVDLLMSTAFMESGWQANAVSTDGAVGVGQLLPGTAGWLARGVMKEPALNPYNAKDNIRMSARFLRMMLDLNGGNVGKALASYYQGPGSVARDGLTPAATSYAAVVIKSRPLFQ